MPGNVAFGTMIKIGGTAGTAIVNVTNIAGPGMSSEVIDMGAHDSPNAWREFAASLLDAGEITLDLNWDPGAATHKNAAGGLLKLMADRSVTTFALTFPTTPAVTWTMSGIVRQFSPQAPFDDKLSAQVTIKVTGAPTLA